MPGALKFQIKGVEEVNRALEAMGPKNARRIGGNAARAGAREIRDEIKARVPRPGWAKDVRVRTAKAADTGPTERRAVVDFKPKSRGQRLGHIFEFGTVQRYTKKGAFRGRVAARPFMRPGLIASREAALKAMADRLRLELKKEAAKHRGVRVR